MGWHAHVGMGDFRLPRPSRIHHHAPALPTNGQDRRILAVARISARPGRNGVARTSPYNSEHSAGRVQRTPSTAYPYPHQVVRS